MAAEGISAPLPRWWKVQGDAALLWLIPAGLYYAFFLTVDSGGLFAPVNLGLTFNSMLMHVLQGRFDVDPAAIGDEGYRHGDAVYAYFGIFPALVRALLLWLPRFAQTDLTRLACLAAVLMMGAAKLLTVRLLWRHAGARASSLLLAALIAVVLLSGPQVEFLRPSIYQEVELWAGAQQAVFVWLLFRGLCGNEGFSSRILNAMAIVAGLCLMTRVSNALGLYVAYGFIWLCVAWRRLRAGADRRTLSHLVVPCAILGAFIAFATYINFARWGNPLVFVDFRQAMIAELFPDRLALLERYGEFNLGRLGLGLAYYFAPLWGLQYAPFGTGVELPPSTFLLTDPLLIGLCVYGVATALRPGADGRAIVAAAVLGFLVPIGLMLTAFGMSFRYRMEFYPFIELFAFLGFARLAARPTGRTPRIVALGAGASIVVAPAMWLLYMLSSFGPANQVMGSLGLVDFYRSLFQ